MQIRNVNTKNETGKVAFTRDGDERMVVGEKNDIHFCHTCQHGFVSPDHNTSELHGFNTSMIMMCGIGFSGFDSDKPVTLLPISEMLMPEGSILLESNKLLRKDEDVYRYYATGEPLPEDDSFLRKAREERAKNGAISWYMIIVPCLYHAEGIDMAGYIGAYYNDKNKTIEPVILLRKIYQSKGYAKKAVDILCRFIGIYPDDSRDDNIFFFRNRKTVKAGKGGAVDETFYRTMRGRTIRSFSENKMESYRQAYGMMLKVWSSASLIDNLPSFSDFINHYVSMSDNCYRTIAHSEYIESILSRMTLYVSYHKENQRCENLIQSALAPIGNRCISHQENVIIRYTQANGFLFDMKRSTIECKIGFIKDKFMERMLDMFMSRYTLSLNYREQTRARNPRLEIRFKPYNVPGIGQSYLESSGRGWWLNRHKPNDRITCSSQTEKTGNPNWGYQYGQINQTATSPGCSSNCLAIVDPSSSHNYERTNNTNNRADCEYGSYAQYNGQGSESGYLRQEECINMRDSGHFYHEGHRGTTNWIHHSQNVLYQNSNDILSMQRDMIKKQKYLENRIDQQNKALEDLYSLICKTTTKQRENDHVTIPPSNGLMDISDTTLSFAYAPSESLLSSSRKSRTNLQVPSSVQNDSFNSSFF